MAIETQATFGYMQNVVWRALTPDAPAIDGIVEELFPAEAITDLRAFFGAAADADLADRMNRMIASTSAFGANEHIDTVPTSRYVLRTPLPDNKAGPVLVNRARAGWLLLVLLLALFSSLGATTCRFRLGFSLGNIALGIGLVLLGLALFGQVVTTAQGADGFLNLAFGAFDDALDAFLGSTVLSHALLLVWLNVPV